MNIKDVLLALYVVGSVFILALGWIIRVKEYGVEGAVDVFFGNWVQHSSLVLVFVLISGLFLMHVQHEESKLY